MGLWRAVRAQPGLGGQAGDAWHCLCARGTCRTPGNSWGSREGDGQGWDGAPAVGPWWVAGSGSAAGLGGLGQVEGLGAEACQGGGRADRHGALLPGWLEKGHEVGRL